MEERITTLEQDMAAVKSLMQKIVMGDGKRITVNILQPILHLEKTQKVLQLSQEDTLGRLAIVYAEDLLPKDKFFTSKAAFRAIENRFGLRESNPNLSKAITQMVEWNFFRKKMAGHRPDYKINLTPEEAKAQGLIHESTRRI